MRTSLAVMAICASWTSPLSADDLSDAQTYLRMKAASLQCKFLKIAFEGAATARIGGVPEAEFRQGIVAWLVDEWEKVESNPAYQNVSMLDGARAYDFAIGAGYAHSDTEKFTLDCYVFSYAKLLGRRFHDANSMSDHDKDIIMEHYFTFRASDPSTAASIIQMERKICDLAASVYDFRCD